MRRLNTMSVATREWFSNSDFYIKGSGLGQIPGTKENECGLKGLMIDVLSDSQEEIEGEKKGEQSYRFYKRLCIVWFLGFCFSWKILLGFKSFWCESTVIFVLATSTTINTVIYIYTYTVHIFNTFLLFCLLQLSVLKSSLHCYFEFYSLSIAVLYLLHTLLLHTFTHT